MELPVPLILLSTCSVFWLVWRTARAYAATSTISSLPGPPSGAILTGNLKQWFAREGEVFQQHVALDYGPIVRLHGMLGRPMLYVADPKALHMILIKEEPFYQKARHSRKWLAYSSGPGYCRLQAAQATASCVLDQPHATHAAIFYDVVSKLRDAIKASVEKGATELDIFGWMVRVALELIGQGGLGYSFDPLVEEKSDAYAEAIKSLNPTMVRLAILRRVLQYAWMLGPAWFRRSLVRLMPDTWAIPQVVKIVETMDRRSREIYEAKKAALHQGDTQAVKQVGDGKDLMSILMRANMAANKSERLSEAEVLAQMTTFVFAAIKTTSSTLCHILQLLAIHQDVQRQLREELLEARAADGIPYDQLDGLPLLDSVCRETLRLYPPASNMIRVATRDRLLPLSQPISTTDGKTLNEIFVPKGTEILIGVYGSNANKEFWGDDALEWRPHRWSRLPSTVSEARIPGVYSNLLTFIAGKRACIGFKFSEMEMSKSPFTALICDADYLAEVTLAVLVTNFTFGLPEKAIAWNVAAVWYPTVGRDSTEPEMPLKVGLFGVH
ncbi:cytochrome P450 monooxygenase [Fomitopsis serialis]|uniref:cytochrome P450 monooxygenase n=1 Tax=Fomitopsis serialis TaxID=139415 RepID=UPI0020081ECE|nr:cytochrome P450 monooxygenase [Neoantrodia serialis]KAH9919320.1 cytochrome P450 monooxygenase [Neoantrodia serialis]